MSFSFADTRVPLLERTDARTTGFFDVLVADRRQEADEVMSLVLVAQAEQALPQWEPGAHIDVRLQSGLIRQYSLCGDGADPSYTIAVLRDPHGRGGSVELHSGAAVGSLLSIGGPRNHFRLCEARDSILIAGGIGITPILAMARRLHSSRRRWSLYYGGRRRTSMAFLGDLTSLAGAVHVLPEDEFGLLDIPTILDAATDETAIYCCGPAALIRATQAACAQRSLLGNLYIERFSPADCLALPPVTVGSFEVELLRSGRVLVVPPEKSILEVVRSAGTEVRSSCEQGYCGTCETKVICGTPEHRDDFLSEKEQLQNATMLICVSRSRSPRLVLDL